MDRLWFRDPNVAFEEMRRDVAEGIAWRLAEAKMLKREQERLQSLWTTTAVGVAVRAHGEKAVDAYRKQRRKDEKRRAAWLAETDAAMAKARYGG